jgi:hypothetical protein
MTTRTAATGAPQSPTGNKRKYTKNKQYRRNKETHPEEVQCCSPSMVMRDLPPSTSMHYCSLVEDTSNEVHKNENTHAVGLISRDHGGNLGMTYMAPKTAPGPSACA